jgi:hypothetical protein
MFFSSLPDDIVHHIWSYIGDMKLRNGKYMGQISKSDKRYELLLKIRREILQYSSNNHSSLFPYILYVDERLTIKTWMWDGVKQPEYQYCFRGRIPFSYTPH